MKRLVFMTVFLMFFVLVAPLAAQDSPRVINGGVLNGKAILLPKPAYPEDAKVRKAEGSIAIKVTIDEEGNVIEAAPQPVRSKPKKSDDGSSEIVEEEMPDPGLAEAARTAALFAKFSPTRLSGEPVKVTGIITYNFVLSESKALSGGVLNGNAQSLPHPEYPAAAKAVRASGTVSVAITTDEEGNVISASAVSGHPLLRAAAVAAAREAKFNPTYVDGVAVKVAGILTYNFVP